MKHLSLMILLSVLVLLPWISRLGYNGDQITFEVVTISGIAILSTSILFSAITVSLLSLASRSISFSGVLLSIIAGASLAFPLYHVLGSMGGIILGVMAGFVAFLFHQNMIDRLQNRFMVIGITISLSAYLVFISALSSANHTWDPGLAIGAWTGTPQIMVLGSRFLLDLLVTIPTLVITGCLIREKKSLKTKILLISGIALLVAGLLMTLYISFTFFYNTGME